MTTVARNRLGNAGNRFQGGYKKVLCVCSAGLLRSPTLAMVLAGEPFNFNTRAVGIDEDFALIPIDPVHVWWADEIVVMDEYQKQVVEGIQNELTEIGYKPMPVHVTGFPDKYEYRDPKLIKLMKDWAKETYGDRTK